MTLYDISAYLGLLTIAYLCYKAIGIVQFLFHSSTLYRYAHHPSPSLNLDQQLSKPWALVTGASDGIGKAFAQELCSRHFNVVLHGRPGPKLESVKTELEREFKASVRLLALDASQGHSDWPQDFDKKVLTSLSGINLTVLVNNIGGSGGVKPEFSSVADRPAEHDETLLNVNIRFMTHLTRVVLPILIKNSPGLIVNLSSAAESLAAPWTCVYAGAKAYIKHYSHSLRVELEAEGKDVEVVSLTTGKVVTTGTGRKPSDETLDTPNPRRFAKAALDTVGYDSPAIAPYVPHYLGAGVVSLLPRTWSEKIMVHMLDLELERMSGAKKSK